MTVSLDLMSTPMVEMKLLVLESSKNLSSKQDFPTPESPTWQYLCQIRQDDKKDLTMTSLNELSPSSVMQPVDFGLSLELSFKDIFLEFF